jgi:hypothetical protein
MGLQSRVLSEMPFLDAIIVTAPTVRFNDFEIFATPAFCFANPFSIRRSVAVHGRMVRAFFAISSPLVTQWARVLPDQPYRSRIDISSDANAKLPRQAAATSLSALKHLNEAASVPTYVSAPEVITVRETMNRLWWMAFGRAYLRGYKAGLLDGEMACLKRQLDRYESQATQTMAAIEIQQSRLVGEEHPRNTLH